MVFILKVLWVPEWNIVIFDSNNVDAKSIQIKEIQKY